MDWSKPHAGWCRRPGGGDGLEQASGWLMPVSGRWLMLVLFLVMGMIACHVAVKPDSRL
jgi:hypothetical protein